MNSTHFLKFITPIQVKTCFMLSLLSLMLTSFGFSQSFLWANHMGANAEDVGRAITVDSNGNVYTTGYFEGTADFDPGAGTFTLSSAGDIDIFVQKLDPDGNFIWAKRMGGDGGDAGTGIAVDASGNVYTTGYFETTVDFDPDTGTYNLSAVDGFYDDVFVQKLDTDGNFVWAKRMGGSFNDDSYGIAVDTDGNVYTTGTYEDIADFDPGAGTVNLVSDGYQDMFVQKLDTDGNLVWVKRLGGSQADFSRAIAVDASGNVYTTGYYRSTNADFDPGTGTANLSTLGNNDIFVLKLDPVGDFVWAKSLGGTSVDNGLGIALDDSVNVYTTGYFHGTVDFDPGAGNFDLTSAGNNDVFVQKLDLDGNFVWAKSMGGSQSDFSRAIGVDASGNVYTTGAYQGTADFDPGSGTTNLIADGDFDVFVQKLDLSGNFLWAASMGGVSTDQGLGIAVDGSNNVYTTGYFQGAADFDPGAGTATLMSSGSADIYVQKLSQAGVGIDNKLFEAISLYPNPSSGRFRLDLNTGHQIQLTVSDASGRVVYQKNLHTSTDELDVSFLADGMYFLSLHAEPGRWYSGKLIIRR